LGKNHPESVVILGDPKATLPELRTALQRAISCTEGPCRGPSGSGTQRQCCGPGEAARPPRLPPQLLAPLALLRAIAELLPINAVVIDETISSGAGLRRPLQSEDAQSFFRLRGGGIG
jgi:benzoylformate decarboxylase